MIHEKIDLWTGVEIKDVMEDGFRAMMTTYIRSGEVKRGIVVIFPGGGYGYTSPREAEPIAIAFNNAGYHAVFVDYSVAPRRHPQPVLDAARALTIIRKNAQRWQVDLDRIFVCGFSAGGHLCASISNLYNKSWLRETQGIDLEGLKIKGSILAYPVIVYGEHMHENSFLNLLGEAPSKELCHSMSMERQVHEDTPPAFIWHTVEDITVPVENSLMYAQSLQRFGIPFELHIYPYGGHGLSLATSEVASKDEGIIPHVAGWMQLCLEWMEN